MAIYLKNALYIDWQTLEFRRTHIKVTGADEGSLFFLEKWPEHIDGHRSDVVLDCSGKLVTKSFANAHHHVYSALAVGMPAPPISPGNFYEILKYVWWRLDKALDREMIEASALATAVACARNGVTFVVDHHSSPNAVEHSLETIANAFDQVGVSHLLCYELSDRDGERARDEGLAETENYLRSGTQGLVGLHASFTVGERLLRQAVDLAEKYNAGLHVHVAEDAVDQDMTLEQYGVRVIHRFARAGVLDFSKTILAHCLYLDDAEREMLRQSCAAIAQNTESNLNNNVGRFRAHRLPERIMLGTDGMHSDMLRNARVAFLIGQVDHVSAGEIYQRFREIHRYLAVNGLKGDDDNNLVILDYRTPTEINAENFLSHFIYGLNSSAVEGVISSGKLIYYKGKMLTVDEDQVLQFSREMARKLWDKLKGDD